MPRYFFDIHDDIEIIDQEGQELPNLRAARSKAAMALAEAAKDELPDNGPAKDLTVIVRDEAGKVVLTTRLSFSSDPEF
jgi:hypothetical protein